MADSTSGIGGSKPPVNTPTEETKVEQTGERGGQKISARSPQGSQLDRTPSQTANKSLKSRTISSHAQTRSIQANDLNTLKKLAFDKQWGGVCSGLELHANTPKQLSQILTELKKIDDLPPDVQQAAAEQFSSLQARESADILGSNISDDPLEELGTFGELINNPMAHDSPIGTVVRTKVGDFLDKHPMPDIDRQQLIQKISRQTYEHIAKRANNLIHQITASSE